MILLVDVGNSAVKLAALRRGRPVRIRRLPRRAELVAVASVNPPALRRLLPRLRRLGPVRIAGRDFRVPLENRCRGVGIDRLLSAYAAWRRAKGPVVVVDVGTAVTLNVVDARGRFLGGAIFAGPALALEALARGTALLPRVRPGRGPQLGRTTRAALRSGAALACRGFVREGLAAAEKALGLRPRLFVTGGGAGTLGAPAFPDLVLEGLAAAAQCGAGRRAATSA